MFCPSSLPYFITLLVLLQIKHFLADFPFQTEYMLRKTAKDNWLFPLLSHAFAHGLGTAIVLTLILKPGMSIGSIYLLGLLDLLCHFFIDLWKARFARYPISDKRFWIALGFDQFLHQLTYLLIAALVYSASL